MFGAVWDGDRESLNERFEGDWTLSRKGLAALSENF